jgi:uncharacterized protein (TIGR03437 family)
VTDLHCTQVCRYCGERGSFMKRVCAFVLPVLCILSLSPVGALATIQTTVALGSNSGFVALAATTVTVTGGGTITGNIGISPGMAWVPGTPPVTLNGNLVLGGPVAAQAQLDLTTAFNDAAGRQTPVIVAGNIGGQTLTPGLYKSTSSLAISSGDLTLDAQGDGNAVFIFQIASTLTTTSGRQVILAGGANAANIFWQVGSSATLGTTSVMHGNILAAISISVLTGARLNGRALAQGGAVTIDTGGGNLVTLPGTTPATPAISSIVNDATFVAPVSAGSIAAVFGSNLSIGQSGQVVPTPLPTTLAQSSFTIGGLAAPIYFASPGQANVQIPWELAGQNQANVLATVANVASAGRIASLVVYSPGIFTLNMTGTGQGAILNAGTAQLAAPGTPVLRGAYVAIFCTGLGPVTNRPATGSPAPAAPLSFSLVTPTVTIGGVSAQVSYSGLAPTLVGLWQINAVVPAAVVPGDAVPVLISVAGTNSNTVTIAVR